MADSAPAPPPDNSDALVQSLLQKFSTPPSLPSIIPFQKAKDQIQQQRQALQPPPAPQLEMPPTNAPTAQITDALSAFTPDMMALAALGGALGGGITSMVQNATGFINGIHQGDAEATKNAHDEFNQHLDSVVKKNQTAVDAYKAAHDKYQDDSGKLMDEWNGIANQENDEVIRYKLAAGQFDEVYKIIDARQKIGEQIQNKNTALQRALGTTLGQPQMVETSDGKQVLAQQDKAGLLTGKPGQWVTADENHNPVEGVQGAVTATTAGLPQANQGMAGMIASYAIPPLSGYALRSASGQQIMADVQKLNPKYNANNYEMVKDTIDQFSKGQPSQRLTSINTAIQHLQTLREIGDALNSGNVQVINAVKQKFQIEFGEPMPTNFDAIVRIVGQEVVKSVVNSGGGVAERRDTADSFSRIGSPAQIGGAVDSVTKLLAGQANSLRQQYESRTKDIPGILPFDEFLMPETQKALSAVRSESAGGKATPADADYLKAHDTPDMRQRYDAEFGPGSAAKVLGQ